MFLKMHLIVFGRENGLPNEINLLGLKFNLPNPVLLGRIRKYPRNIHQQTALCIANSAYYGSYDDVN